MSSRPDARLQAAASHGPNLFSRLVALRRIEVLAQSGVLFFSLTWLKIPLAVLPMTVVIALLAALNLVSQWRIGQGSALTDRQVFGHLLTDTLALAVLLYYAGGSTNPFVSLFLLPPTLAAALLPPRHAWAMAGLTLACYTFLIFWKLPLPAPQGDLAQLEALLARAMGHAEHAALGQGFALHVVGMWLNFVISVGIVAFFVSRMATALRDRERQLTAAREEALRNEQILALGTFAAGAAHQLGTPLATMAVILRDLEVGNNDNDSRKEDLSILREQIDRCKQILSQVLAAAGTRRDESLNALPLDAYLRKVIDDWRLLRPHVLLECQLEGIRPSPVIAVDPTLQQAILNLLDNAADAQDKQPEPLRIVAGWDRKTCRIEIMDCGQGLLLADRNRLGQAFYTTKKVIMQESGGMGIGLFLANATLERFGGHVELCHREDGRRGTCTRITLSLSSTRAEDHVGTRRVAI